MMQKRDIIYICRECGVEVKIKNFSGRKKPTFCKDCIKKRNYDSRIRYNESKKCKEKSKINEERCRNSNISNVNQEARNSGMSYGQWVARYKNA